MQFQRNGYRERNNSRQRRAYRHDHVQGLQKAQGSKALKEPQIYRGRSVQRLFRA